MNAKQIATYVVSLGIGVVLFYLAFSIVDDKEALWENMRSVRWEGIAASFVMGYLAIVSRGLRWGILLEPLGRKAGKARSVHAVAFAYFANTFVPRSGELARCAALNQTDDIPVDELFGTVISERVIDFVFLKFKKLVIRFLFSQVTYIIESSLADCISIKSTSHIINWWSPSNNLTRREGCSLCLLWSLSWSHVFVPYTFILRFLTIHFRNCISLNLIIDE